LLLGPAYITQGIPPIAHKLEGLISVQPLNTRLKVDGVYTAILGILVVHPFLNVYGNPAQSIHDILKSIVVRNNIVINLDTSQQIRYRPHGQTGAAEKGGAVNLFPTLPGNAHPGIPWYGKYAHKILFRVHTA